jgi:hypothetical protein
MANMDNIIALHHDPQHLAVAILQADICLQSLGCPSILGNQDSFFRG